MSAILSTKRRIEAAITKYENNLSGYRDEQELLDSDKERVLSCWSPIPYLPLAVGGDFTHPREHL